MIKMITVNNQNYFIKMTYYGQVKIVTDEYDLVGIFSMNDRDKEGNFFETTYFTENEIRPIVSKEAYKILTEKIIETKEIIIDLLNQQNGFIDDKTIDHSVLLKIQKKFIDSASEAENLIKYTIRKIESEYNLYTKLITVIP